MEWDSEVDNAAAASAAARRSRRRRGGAGGEGGGFVALKHAHIYANLFSAKIPFPLTQRFRGMLQNGIDLSTVAVSYVSSRSWYFLNLFGLRGLFSLILGEENATDDAQKMMQMGGGFGFNPTMCQNV
ncbi:unnamed protein product [Miscanthus lutarioriparius]|uniref:ER membrane protein complex subunit 3 n=1 Tax=Miscanthus lutarioriparius TaxID=422564 RepID=A0A811QJ52_9POAL|nr:unnamed protein product [Miscanthus lutarioriparius]